MHFCKRIWKVRLYVNLSSCNNFISPKILREKNACAGQLQPVGLFALSGLRCERSLGNCMVNLLALLPLTHPTRANHSSFQYYKMAFVLHNVLVYVIDYFIKLTKNSWFLKKCRSDVNPKFTL